MFQKHLKHMGSHLVKKMPSGSSKKGMGACHTFSVTLNIEIREEFMYDIHCHFS